jgi:hypothetical protein
MDDYDREFDEAVAAAARHRRRVIGTVQIIAGLLTTIAGGFVWVYMPDIPIEDRRLRWAGRWLLLGLGVVLLGAGFRTIFKEETVADFPSPYQD